MFVRRVAGLQRVSSRRLSTVETVKDYSKERKLSALELQHLHRKGKKIAMVTAYDYPSVLTLHFL